MNQHIPLTATPLKFTPKSGPDGLVLLIKPLTQALTDSLGFELFRHNIAPISSDTFRATMIDEIFALYGDVDGEKYANLMDEYWQGEDTFSLQQSEWQQAERDRLWDERHGGPARPPLAPPRQTVPVRQRAKAQMLAEQIREASQRMRDLTIEMQQFERKSRDGVARLVIEEWRGASTPFKKVDGIIPTDVFAAFKAEVGAEVVAELARFIDAGGRIDEEERGNSASPPESGSSPSGSPATNDASAPSAGSSTAEPSGQIPEGESAETTGSSSKSTSDASGDSPNVDTTPTDGP